MWNPKKPNSQKQGKMLVGARGWGIGEMLFKGTNLQQVGK